MAVKFQPVSDLDLLRFTLMNRCKLTNNGCWEWQRGTDGKGYGTVNWDGKTRRAHRISFEAFACEPIPKGLVVRHTCDNTACISPNHLVLGTQAENVADREARGRGGADKRRGELAGTSKLTAEQVLEIKQSDARGVDLAKQYGVSVSTVSLIRLNKSWRHIEPQSTSRH